MNLGPYQSPVAPPLPAIVLVALAGLYLLTGITGHDPWKTEDAIHIAIAHGFVTGGDWLFPQIAGEAWPHTAPLYHWVAAALGKLLGGWMPFHEAARLATSLFGALFLLALSGAARAFHGEAASRTAPLLALGTLGLLLPMHEAQPAIAGLAMAALAWWGAGLLRQGKARGALPLGLGFGLAFPAHGLAGLIMALAALPAPSLRRDWKGQLLALAIALPLLAFWPLLVSRHAPGLWSQWWANEIAEATVARGLPVAHHLEQLVWAAWPVLPLAVWSLWLNRHQPAPLALPVAGTLITLLWYLTGSSRTLSLLPLLLPLTLVAAASADRLRRGAANAFDWFGLITFSCAAMLIWLGASAQALDWPPRIARNFDKLAPGHAVHYSIAALSFAVLVSLAWLVSLGLRRAGWRASLRWAAGTTLMWTLVATLWLSWIDHVKTYRPVVAALHAALPADAGCLERVNLGPTHRASLDYFAGIRTVAPSGKRQCGWRLVIDERDRKPTAGWSEHWQGNRPGDHRERWYLDRRID